MEMVIENRLWFRQLALFRCSRTESHTVRMTDCGSDNWLCSGVVGLRVTRSERPPECKLSIRIRETIIWRERYDLCYSIEGGGEIWPGGHYTRAYYTGFSSVIFKYKIIFTIQCISRR